MGQLLNLPDFTSFIEVVTAANFGFSFSAISKLVSRPTPELGPSEIKELEVFNDDCLEFAKVQQKVMQKPHRTDITVLQESANECHSTRCNAYIDRVERLVLLERVYFFLLAFYGVIILLLSGYVNRVTVDNVEITLFYINWTLSLVMVAMLFVQKHLERFKDYVNGAIVVFWIAIVLSAYFFTGRLDPDYFTISKNEMCVYPYTFCVLGFGFLFFFFSRPLLKAWGDLVYWFSFRKVKKELGKKREALKSLQVPTPKL